MSRLLLLSGVRWDFLWQRHQALALAAAQAGWAVDFVEPPIRGFKHARAAALGRSKGVAPAGVPNPVPEGVRVFRLPPTFLMSPGWWQRRYVADQLEARYDACVLYLPTTSLVDLAERVTDVRVYDNVVDWGTAPAGWFPPADYTAAEARMEGNGWRRMTDSLAVANRHRDAARQCLVLPPAADREFETADWSEPVGGQPALYFGTVRSTETDVELLCDAARAGVPIQVVGPIDDARATTALLEAGVACSPAVLPSELPALVNGSSALLLPYKSKRADTLVPAKLWNCLATNRTILQRGLSLPQDLRENFATLPSNNDGAVALIKQAVAVPERRAGRVEGWNSRWREVEHLFADAR